MHRSSNSVFLEPGHIHTYLDKKLARVYDILKRAFGFDDRFATKILKLFYRKKD